MKAFPSIFDNDEPRAKVRRGHGSIDRREAARLAARFPGPTFPLMGAPIPELLRYRGIVLQGAQGSGKTLSILRLLLPVIMRLKLPEGRHERLIVVDLKGDLTSALLGMARAVCPGVRVCLLNPFDMFGWALDPHEFTTTPARIARLVSAMTYRRRDARTDDFFDNTARSYLRLLVAILNDVLPRRWTWRMLYQIATSYGLLRRVMKRSPLSRMKFGSIVRKTFSGQVGTIDSWLSEFESSFACWERSPKLRLEEFCRGSGILIITAPEDQREVLTPITRLVLRIVKDRILGDTGRNADSRTTIVLDEFADLEELATVIMPFFGRSRSAQASLICAWQSWPAACAAHGETQMRAIIDNAAVRVWFACGEDSAEVAAKNCRSAELVRPDVSVGYRDQDAGPVAFTASSPSSRTVNFRTELVRNVIPGQISGLLPPCPGDMTVRAFITAGHLPGPLYAEEDYGPFVSFLNRLPKVKHFRERPASALRLKPWDDVVDGALLDELLRG